MTKLILILTCCTALIVVSTSPYAAGGTRKALHTLAPEKYSSILNPFASDADAKEIGERIYVGNCSKCHEENRRGQRKGPSLNRPEIQNAAPGALFWVLEKGDQNRGMPSFARFPEKYRWQVVTYLQSR